MDRSLIAERRQVYLLRVFGSKLGDGDGRVSGGDGLEGQSGDDSLPVGAGRVGRTCGGEGDEAVAFVAVRQGDSLVAFREQRTGVDAKVPAADGGGNGLASLAIVPIAAVAARLAVVVLVAAEAVDG